MESHATATGLVINKNQDKALVIFHKKLQIWLPAGGHVEPGELPHDAVVREVFEETGVKAQIIDISPSLNLSDGGEVQIPAPGWVLHEPIPEYKDKPAHMHYDFIYCLQADSEQCDGCQQEVESVMWVTKKELATLHTTSATRAMYNLLLV